MKFIKNTLIFAGLVLLNISCSDFLEEKGYNADYTYYNTSAGFEALTISCYQQTRWSANGENHISLEDMGTDIWMLGGDGGNRDAFGQFLTSAMTPQNSLLKYFWDNNYKGISSCNLALQMIDGTDLDAATKAIRKGEILFLRAYYYYELAEQFGDVPLVLTPVDEPKTDFVRVPQKQVWAQILSDARQAYDLLPWASSGKVTGNWGRASKGAAGHLLAKAYMFRYGDTFAKNQSDSKMNEDRGGKATDLDSVIYYASRVANYGEGAGSGSPHALAPNYSDLWGWNQKTGITAEYAGNEILFSVDFSTTAFYNNVAATDVGAGNQLHMYYTGQMENYALTTKLESGTSVSWGGNVGITRDLITGRPWRRLCPTDWYYKDNGLYAAKNYETGKLGKLVDSRLYKSHHWVYYCNNAAANATWQNYTNAAGSFDPASIGMVAGTQKYTVGDTALVLTLEDVSTRPGPGTKMEKLALARAKEKYFLVPMLSIRTPLTRGEVAGYDVITNNYPPLAKWLDNRRAAANDMGGFRNFFKMRLAETYILLSEAYARKGNFADAAETLNKVRERAAWKEGEEKYAHYWKYDGGSYATRKASTVNDMKVSAGFIGSFTGDALTDFYMDEMAHETAGELNRFGLLVRYGADYWFNKVKACDYFVSNDNGVSNGNIKKYHRFRPIPQTHIDNISPADPNAQNYGYY